AADLDGVVVRAGARRRAIDRDALAAYDVAGRAVLMHTGWDRYWGSKRYGAGHPFLTAAAAGWLAGQQGGRAGPGRPNLDAPNGPGGSGAHRAAGGWHPDGGALVRAGPAPARRFSLPRRPAPGRWHRQLPGPRLRRDRRWVGLRPQPNVLHVLAVLRSVFGDGRFCGSR